MPFSTPGKRLARAHDAALAADKRLDRLFLKPVTDGIPNLPVHESIISAKAILTIEGASTVQVDILDPDWLIERSGVLGPTDRGRLRAIDITLDTLAYRLDTADREGDGADTMTLTFEDRAVALLRTRWGAKRASRGSMTRARFIESLVNEVKAYDIPFYAPEKGRKQPRERPDYPDTAPARGETGFGDGATFKLKNVTADAAQRREVETAMGVADQEGANGRARLAMIVAGIGESSFRDVPNAAGSPYGGVFQALKTRGLSTSEQARYFLKGGQGFQSGGAIEAARQHPEWSPGTIAYKVEGSRANFGSDAAAEHHYQQHIEEARKIDRAWARGDQSGGDDAPVRVRAYQFTRGTPGDPKENSWEAALRLAEQVGWRFYVAGGVAAFISDEALIDAPETLILKSPKAPGLIERPGYKWARGKLPSEVELHVNANRYAIAPGAVVGLDGDIWGPIEGKWIVHTAEYNLFDAADTVLTLVKPIAPRNEPAPEISADNSPTGSGAPDAGTGASDALAWARSKLGHYKETLGSNVGPELDRLEQTFNMHGQPWCAMFATTAVSKGGVGRECRTAAVAQIRAWAAEGSHGYQRGFRATPRPGDLMCFGTAHVVLVEKVHGTSVTTIDGNPSAGKVVRGSRVNSTGDFVRPDYPT